MLRGDGGKQATASLEIVRPLGAGGFGAVYEAIDTRTGQRVAVKELDDRSGEGIARFKQEYRVLADCHHAHLVGLKELIEQDGRWLIVMELVPGSDFLHYVQRADNDNDQGAERALFDEARLRSTLIGMAEGLRALHAFGVVHRDLKPSNVRVRPDGRAVLLDFGLATRLGPSEQSTQGLAVGTVAYMAPEQASGRAVGPEADLYALGVCLFEALTGRRPIEGESAISVMLEKQHRPAPRARSLTPGVPHDLDELCARLLAIEPGERPSAEQVLALLTDRPVSDQNASSLLPAPLFAGRESELAHLQRALARTHVGEQRLVLIEGESGVGKSELVSEFLRQAQHEHTALVALRGRCYESEQLAYKAFDGCIDELARVLRRMPESECSALMPERAALLGQLFPVLQNIAPIAQAPRVGSSADPTARRLEAFGALSQLLAKLAEERPLVLVLDDLQWADVESFRLLHALHEQAMPAPILFLATVRPRAELDEALDAQIEAIRAFREADTIPLLGLPREQAKGLAGKLLGEGAPSALLELVAQESQGHPLFMSELVRHAASSDFSARGALTIDGALRARIEQLTPSARELLELVAVAVRPYPARVFAQALSSEIDEDARALLGQKLLRQRKGHEIGCFHDRIRQVTGAMIPGPRLAVLHYQLAVALSARLGGDASEQARHWDLAGQPERASKAYEQVAQRALDALAFMRAAALFERALSLLSEPSAQVFTRLTSLRADALAWAGRSAEAADLYRAAAARADGEQRVVLRSHAARHLILGAKIAEGLKSARALLGELGFHLPESVPGMLLRVGWDALRLWWRGDQLARSSAPEHERLQIDAARELLSSVALVHPLAYLILLRQYLLRALRSNSPHESVVTFAMLGWFRAFTGRWAKARSAFSKADRLLSEHTNPVIVARQRYLLGSSYMAVFDWAGSLKHLQEAERIAHDHCKDNPALLTIIRYHLGGAWFHVGDHAQLGRQLERWLAEARERNDVLSQVLLSGMGHGLVRHLLRDAPQDAQLELERFQRAVPPTPYSFVHLGQLMTGVVCHLYLGGDAAARFLDAHEAEHARAFMLKSSTGRQALLILRTMALLSACASCPPQRRPALLAQARKTARALLRWRSDYVRAFVALAEAQILAVEGRREQALALARKAGESFRAQRHAQRRGAHFLEALLEGGPAGQAKREGVLAELRREGWRNPERSIQLHAPLCALLMESPSAPRASLLRERYQILHTLGRGGFGSVVAARDEHSGRTLALKELVAKGGMSLERFKQEFRALAELHHEHVVQLEELFEHEGSWYIAMELVSGTDLLSYVRPGGACDVERLRRSTIGVARALSALHHSGFVHRDVKPENILVTPDGRPVLIDFGLLARVGDRRDALPIGSMDYAAPEQLAGSLPSTASDVYGLGACLYAAISGKAPLASDAGERFSAKRRAPAELVVPAELSELAVLTKLMLSPDPAARPSLDALIALCGEDAPLVSKGSSLTRAGLEETAPEALFMGRERERAELRTRFVESRRSARVVLIEGESGLGKSALAAEFGAQLREQRPDLSIFSARCYENEQVAFKAFDRVVDMLAGHLRGLSRAHCELLLPRRAALLAQLFPVLSSVPAIAAAPRKGLPADPTTRKQQALEAFVALLEKFCAQGELLLVIDDLQWADRESFALLRRLLERPAQLPLLIVCTVRPKAEIEATNAGEIAALRALPCTSSLALGALEPAAARALAERLLGEELTPERISALVAESNGHPLFLRELIAHEQRGSSARVPTLDAALAARVAALSPTARDLLALVALADKPHGGHVFARALGLGELPREALVSLLGQGLLRRRGERIAWYHDRIRRAAVAPLSAEQRARFACDLARALEASGESAARLDAAERARLWHEGGEAARAIDAYEQAGALALEGFAFSVAEKHYERALTLLGESGDESARRRLLTARGHALARAGRSADAARVFQSAAQHAQGEERVRLHIWVAQHLIQSARIDEGLSTARDLLGELGVKLATSDGQALRALLWQRVRGKLQRKRPRGQAASGREQLTLEALHGLSQPVRAVSLLPGSVLVAEYLRRARDLGDPRHSARALAYKGMFRGMKRSDDKREALFAEAHRLAESTGDHALIAEVELTHGFALVTQHQNQAAPPYLMRAHERLMAHCPGHPWLVTSARMFLGTAWFYTHRFHELRSHGGVWLEEARARDDRYAIAALAGMGAASFRFALEEQPEAALAELEEAMAPWSRGAVTTTHVGAYLTATSIIASCDDGPRYMETVEREMPRLARAFLMRYGEGRYMLHGIRIQALLKSVRSRAAADTPQLLRKARAELAALRKLKVIGAANQANYLEAWMRMVEGDLADALRLAQLAHESLVADGQPHQLMTLYLIGALEGGAGGSAKCAEARAGFEAEGWKDWRRGLAMRLPGRFDLLERERAR